MIINKIKKAENSVNSNTFKLEFKNNKYFIKIYNEKSNFSKDLLINKLLLKQMVNVPKVIDFNIKKRMIIFTLVNGKKISKLNKDNLIQIFKFLKNFQKIKQKYNNLLKNKKNILYAKDNCLNFIDHYKNLTKRLKSTKKNFKNDKQIINLIKNKIENKLLYIQKFKTILKEKNVEKKILSPSDFGLHNILKEKKKLFFFDFDYAGIDSPLKLKLDFILNPNHNFTKSECMNISKKFDNLFNIKVGSRIENLLIKINILKWLLIILSAIKKKPTRRSFYLKNFFLYYKKYTMILER